MEVLKEPISEVRIYGMPNLLEVGWLKHALIMHIWYWQT